jgi:hypothetical protein
LGTSQRFPADFMFQLTAAEKAEVVTNCDHLAKLEFSESLPFAFTEQGAIQASNVLAPPQAVEMDVYVVRAFVRLREFLASNRGFGLRLDDLEEKTEALALQHDTFAHGTRAQLKQVFEAIRQLTTPPDPPKRPIGFVTPEEKRWLTEVPSVFRLPGTPETPWRSRYTDPAAFDERPGCRFVKMARKRLSLISSMSGHTGVSRLNSYSSPITYSSKTLRMVFLSTRTCLTTSA